jgi:hypothetical protein
MAFYEIYAGMGGGFGGAKYIGTYEYEDEEDALDDARMQAVEEYQSYEGSHGIMSWDDCKADLEESFPDQEFDEEDIDMHYEEELESWLSYYVQEVDPLDVADANSFADFNPEDENPFD